MQKLLTMNARYTILEALKRWGYTVCETEGIDILLDNGITIEILQSQRSVVIDSTIYEAEDNDVEYIDMLEAANILNDGFFVHSQYYVSEEWMDVTGRMSFDYANSYDLQMKLRKALFILERMPEVYELTLRLVQENDEIDVKPIWDAVGDVAEEYARKVLAGKTILYIHGFASSGNSGTAREIQKLLPDSRVISPDLPVDPNEAYDMLCHILDDEDVDIMIGTSMGGMFANVLNGVPKVLVNPSFHVSESMRKKIGVVPFFKQRADGTTEFEVTEQLCDAYQKLERRQFAFSHERDTGETFALFGTDDDVINCKEEYEKYFGDAYINVSCGHRLTPEVIKRDLLPIMTELVARNS